MSSLESHCRNIRKDIFMMINNAQCGHFGGSLSCVEILVSLYFDVMNIDPAQPLWEERDRFINSKGHATAAYYATLANRGYVERDELVNSFIDINSHFEEHGSTQVRGVDISTGSLGQGISVGAGMALAAKRTREEFRTYVLIGDGECQEGQIWEAALFSSHYRLDNLVVVIDRTRLQVSGDTEEVIAIEPLDKKWASFNWEVSVVDGHNLQELIGSLSDLNPNGSPKVFIAETVKGKGISFMENNADWHSFRTLNKEEIEVAERELGIDSQ
jgi:transketolase